MEVVDELFLSGLGALAKEGRSDLRRGVVDGALRLRHGAPPPHDGEGGAFGDGLWHELAVLDGRGSLHKDRIDLHTSLVARPIGSDKTKVAAAQVRRFVDAVLAGQIVVLRDGEVVLGCGEYNVGVGACFAKDSPQVDAFGRVAPAAVVLLILRNVIRRNRGC